MVKNGLDSYHKAMRDCAAKTTPIIQRNLERLVESSRAETRELLFKIHVKRANSPRLREFLLESAWNAICSKPPPIHLTEFGAAIELYNLSTYMINWVLDGKGDLSTSREERLALTLGMRLYDHSVSMIWDLPESAYPKELVRGLVEVNSRLYEGQEDDLTTLNVHSGALKLTPKEYDLRYKETCARKCGYFLSYVTKTGGLLANGNTNQVEALKEYGLALGKGIQAVNDVADNIPSREASSVERQYQDQFSDMRNGFITYPLYELVHRHPDAIRYIGRDLNTQEKDEVFSLLLRKNCFDPSMLLTRSLREHHAKPLLRRAFPDVKRRRRLSEMTAILDSSKIYRELREGFGYKLAN